MEEVYIKDKRFGKEDFTESLFANGDYDNCRFVSCNFSNTDLAKTSFIDCSFTSCNLSMAKLTKTAFKNCTFIDCKLFGLHFEDCEPFLFKVDFENCQLTLSSFYKMRIKNTRFKNCNLSEVDFTEADLTNALFDNCDLTSAKFEKTILEQADLRSSYNYSINPELNKIKKASFSIHGIAGLLDKYDIIIE